MSYGSGEFWPGDKVGRDLARTDLEGLGRGKKLAFPKLCLILGIWNCANGCGFGFTALLALESCLSVPTRR